jgi:hypothetical protein
MKGCITEWWRFSCSYFGKRGIDSTATAIGIDELNITWIHMILDSSLASMLPRD